MEQKIEVGSRVKVVLERVEQLTKNGRKSSSAWPLTRTKEEYTGKVTYISATTMMVYLDRDEGGIGVVHYEDVKEVFGNPNDRAVGVHHE